MDKKTCSKCGEEKPLGEFHKNKRSSTGVMSRCKACSLAAGAAKRASNRMNRVPAEAKACTICGEVKEPRHYHKDDSKLDGLMTRCKECRRRYQAENRDKFAKYYEDNKEEISRKAAVYREKNKEAHQERYRKYRQEHPDRIREAQKRFKENHPDAARDLQLQYCYGITIEDYHDMLREQGECCYGCGAHQSTLPRALDVDHCHDTGRVRALLCRPCNLTLGFAKDNPDTLDKLSQLLRKLQDV